METNMDVKAQDFKDHFHLLSDEALLAVNRDDLVPIAQQCLDEEIAARGLDTVAVVVEDEPVAAEDEPSPEEEELAVVATYDVAEDGEAARQTLEDAGIPARLIQNPDDMEGTQMELMVPESKIFQALDALGLRISEEELAAQAEAAAPEE